MENLQEQQLPPQLCIGAPMQMQREELPDSRSRQAAETKGGQNEDQIWQRAGDSVNGYSVAGQRLVGQRLRGQRLSVVAVAVACALLADVDVQKVNELQDFYAPFSF
jgi:hypothetical protein